MYGQIKHDSEGLVICHLCGKSFNKLGAHIRMTHKMLTSTYRKKFGLDQNSRLMSEYSISLARKRNKENYKLVVEENLLIKGINTRYKDGYPGRTKDKIREETKIRLSHKGSRQWN